MVEIIVLILRIITIIVGGRDSVSAVHQIANESGISFSELWDNLPGRYK